MHDERRRSRSASSASSTSASCPPSTPPRCPSRSRPGRCRTSRCRSPRPRPPRTSRSRSAPRGGRPGPRPGSGPRQVPAEWAGQRVEAVFDLGFVGDWPGNQAEALVHLPDGTPLKGIAPLNQYVPVANPATGGEQVDFLVEAAANPDILADDFSRHAAGRQGHRRRRAALPLPRADLAVLDEDVWHLGLDIEVLRELMLELDEHDPRRHEILRALERALDALDLDDVAGTAAAARAALAAPWPGPRTPARTPSPPSATRTSTAPGCGRCARPSARPPAPSPTSPRSPRSTRSSSSPARRPSSTRGSRTTTRRSSTASRRPSRPASGRRSAACGSRPTATCPAARPWPASSSTASGSSSRVRRRDQGRLAARLLRLHRGVPAARQARRATSGS